MRHYRLQLVDDVTKKAIISAGGAAYVAVAGAPDKIALKNKDGAAIANPVALVNGILDFYVADEVASADLFIQSPTGHFVVVKGVTASGPNSIYVDKSRTDTLMVIPFSIADTTATTETDTGFDLVTNSAVLPLGVGLDVTTLDATQTINVGILSGESGGDADGFIAAGSVAAAASVIAGNVVTAGGTETYFSSTTLGALVNDFLAGANVAGDVGTTNPKAFICNGTAKSISYTLNSGTDTAKGYLKIPVQLPFASL